MHQRNSSITRLSAAIAVALAVFTVACGEAPASPAAPSIQNRLVGTVTDSTANGPLEGAVITHLASSRSATTDHTGAYSIEPLPTGFAAFTVARSGYHTVTRSAEISGETRLDLQLARREPLGPSALWGVVYERTPSGELPVAGVHVEDSNTHLSTKTDAEGRYRLDFAFMGGLFDSFVRLYVAKEGYQTISLEMGVVGDTRLDLEIVRR